MTTKETIKQALISIFVVAVIAFITTLLQGLVEWLKDINLKPIGSLGGMLYYAVKMIKNTYV